MRDVIRPSASRASEHCAMSAGGMVLFFALAMILWWLSGSEALPRNIRDALWILANVCIFITIIAGGLSTTWFYLRATSLAKHEESRGYSTGAYNPRAVRIVDPKSGLILREANDPVLGNRREVREARASASERFDARTATVGGASGGSNRTVTSDDRE